MANKDQDLVDMGMTPQEIAYINTMASQGGLNAGAGGIAMQMQNNTIARNNLIKEVMAKRGTTGASTATGSASNQQSQSSSFAGIADGPERDSIKALLNSYISGTNADYNAAQAQKNQSLGEFDRLLGDYTKQAAFQDSADLVQANINKTMEAQKPAIQKAIEGSGTSSGSMQALLSQKLANEASLSAGSLGAQQAVAYGQIASGIAGNRGQLTTGKADNIGAITSIADLLKTQTQQSNSSSMSNFNPNTMLGGNQSWSTSGIGQKKPVDEYGNIVATNYGLGVNTLFGTNSLNTL